MDTWRARVLHYRWEFDNVDNKVTSRMYKQGGWLRNKKNLSGLWLRESVLYRLSLGSLWARGPYSALRKRGKPLALGVFLPIRSVDKGMGDWGAWSICFHLMTKWWGWGLGSLFLQRAICALIGSWAYCTYKDWLFFQMRVSPSVMGGSKCGHVVPWWLYSAE